MADSKTSALTAVVTPAGTDEFPVNQGGTSKKETLAQIKSFVETGLLAPGAGSYASDHVQIGPGANATSTLDNFGSVAVGRNATAGDYGSVGIGDSSNSAGTWGVAIGYAASAPTGSNGSVAIGKLAAASDSGTSLGGKSDATGAGATAVGQFAIATHNFGIALGYGSTTTAANQMVVGSAGEIAEAYIGKGVTNATPGATATITSTGGSGSNVAGTSVVIAGGKGTGNAAGGGVIFKTSDAGASGSTLQSLTEKCRVPVEGGFQWTGNGTKPTAGSAYRGMVWYTPGDAGVLDKFEICRKDAADAYAWVSLF